MTALDIMPGSAAERWWWIAALGFLGAFLILATVDRFDVRVLSGESVLAKPMKFAISIAVHFATAALVVRQLSEPTGGDGLMRWIAVISIAAAVFEVAYIAFQGARGEASHFNVSSPIYTALWGLMAFAALLVLMPFAVLGAATVLDAESSMTDALRIGVATGLIASAVLTAWVGFTIGANMSHFIGDAPATSVQVPVLGWSLDGADLRPAHFMALHAAQAIPLAAVAFGALLNGRFASLATIMSAVIWIAVTCWLLRATLSGQSLGTMVSRPPIARSIVALERAVRGGNEAPQHSRRSVSRRSLESRASSGSARDA